MLIVAPALAWIPVHELFLHRGSLHLHGQYLQRHVNTGIYALAYYSSGRHARDAEDSHRVDAALLS